MPAMPTRPPPVLRLLVAGLLLLPWTAPPLEAGEALARARERTRAGAQALEQGALDEALAAFEVAHRLQPDDAAGRRNLALALARRAREDVARRDGEASLAKLERALELHPGRVRYQALRARALLLAGRRGTALREAQALVARSPAYGEAWAVLAEVQERQGDLEDALESLARLTALRGEGTPLDARVADLRRRAEAEAGFATHGTGNFIARYDPNVDAGQVQLALTILEDAYSHVSADLGLAPRTPAQVVLYDGAEFQRVTGAHSWVGALYQHGVLRVPIRNLERHRSTAERVLTHEFTHHVLRERTPGLPSWWHEGIAQHLEDSPANGRRRRAELRELLQHQKQASRLLTLDEMQRLAITRVQDANVVKLFYAQAHAFVGWLADTYGAGSLPAFLTALGSGTALDAAAKQAFGGTQAELWAAWSEQL